MLAFAASWLTPSSLFLFLNLMIGTLFLMSRFGTRQNPTHEHRLVRSGSLLERVKSFNLSLYKFESSAVETEYLHPTEPHYSTQFQNPTHPSPLTRTPSFMERMRSIDLSYIYRFDHQQTHPEPEPEILRPEANTPAYHHSESEHSTQFQNPTQPPTLTRTPSFMERLRSIDLSYMYRFDHQQAHHVPEPEILRSEPNTPAYRPIESERSSQFQNPTNTPKLARTPSFLERLRLRAVDLAYVSRFDHQQSYPEPKPKTREPEAKTSGPNPAEDESHDHPPVKRSKSESHHSTRAEKKSQAEKMTKSSSEKMGHGGGKDDGNDDEDEEEVLDAVERRRPATTRVEKTSRIADETTSLKDFDDGVDAKADDFINRFKQQLKLQRLESFKRFSEMISRGSSLS